MNNKDDGAEDESEAAGEGEGVSLISVKGEEGLLSILLFGMISEMGWCSIRIGLAIVLIGDTR